MTHTAHEPQVALARLRRAQRTLITSHANPDGDALGSELALAELLHTLGREAVIANLDPAPATLSELPGLNTIRVGSLPEGFPTGFDLVVTLECPGLDRAGLDGLSQLPIVNIDHHMDNSEYGEINYLDAKAPAVGEMVLALFNEAEVNPSPTAATNIYVALYTDTGGFRYSNTTSRAFVAATQLVEAGADPEAVGQWIHERRSLGSARLLGEALSTLELLASGRLAVMSVDEAAFERAGAVPADTEELINVPRAISGVQVAAFLKQTQPDTVRVSLRSKGSVDVRMVAAAFGGGGHTNAAGCTLHTSLRAAREALVSRLLPAVGGSQ
jgi:phosphoesterase RecJ-like protein